MSNSRDFYISAAALMARFLHEQSNDGGPIIAINFIMRPQVGLKPDVWKSVFGEKDGVHTVERQGNWVYYSYTEDGVEYSSAERIKQEEPEDE